MVYEHERLRIVIVALLLVLEFLLDTVMQISTVNRSNELHIHLRSLFFINKFYFLS